jgi:hypothetical protein
MNWYKFFVDYAAHSSGSDPNERHLTFASYGHRDETKASVEQTKSHKATTRYNNKKRK